MLEASLSICRIVILADHAHEPLSETAAYDTRLRLSSCRIHSTVRFQLALFLIRQPGRAASATVLQG